MRKPLAVITGEVQKGKKRGKVLGYPTINLIYQNNIPHGVFVSKTIIENIKYNSITFTGKAKTFDENISKIETYIFNFNKNIYGKIVKVLLYKKIRDVVRFLSKEALIAQIENDIKKAKKWTKKVS